jgi:hypothetical protein
MSLSTGSAWRETAAFARHEARLLFTISFFLLALPAAILQLIAPVTAPGRLPEAGPWLLFMPVVPAASLIGALAISRLSLCPEEGAGAAFTAAFRRFAPLLGALLLVALPGAMLAMAAVLLTAILASPVFSSLSALALLILLVFAWVRMLLLTPAAAIEPIGPAQLLLRSWTLAAGNFIPLLGLILAVVVASFGALMAAGAVGGLAAGLPAGQPQPGALAMVLFFLTSALLQAAISGLFTIFVARLYAQLSAEDPAR